MPTLELLTDDILAGADRLEDLVHFPGRPVVFPPPRTRYHVIKRTFSLGYEEAEELGPKGLKDLYIKETGRQLILELRAIAKRFGRKLTFRRWKLPANTTHRRVFEYDRNGVWVGVIVCRKDEIIGKRKDGQPRTQRVLEVTIGTCIALEGDQEKLPKAWVTHMRRKPPRPPSYEEDKEFMRKSVNSVRK